MESETKQCKQCSTDFVIEPDDFAFYEKIKVPPPTHCPDCRQQRRYAWRNERTLYRRDCDLCSKSTVTIYHPKAPYKVYCPTCWWSDKWNGDDYARDYDFNKPFVDQFKELQLVAPRIALLTKNSVNSDYTNHSGDDKDCYLCFGVFNSENCMYCTNMFGEARTKDCMDCYRITEGGELLYECLDSQQSYSSQFCIKLTACSDCLYCYDMSGCSNCLFSYNLRNKSYCIFNKQYTKDEYKEKLKEYRLGSYETRKKMYDQWINLMKKDVLYEFATKQGSVDVTGNNVINSKHAYQVFDANDHENTKYCILSIDTKDSMDSYHFGISSELIYESHGLTRGYNAHFTHLCYDNSNIEYCDTVHNSENMFGCVSVKKGSYMIFNKKYAKKEYEELRQKIIEKMKEEKIYGELMPASIAPISYNETQGHTYMPLTKEEVLKRGWNWEDNLPGTFGKETLEAADIPDDIKDVDDSILNEVLKCESCEKNYNIVKPELQLLTQINAPIPRRCPDCRYKSKMELRPPRKLWHRQCMCIARSSFEEAKEGDYEIHKNTATHEHHTTGQCPNEFETPYESGRPEKVYCKECYQAEVL